MNCHAMYLALAGLSLPLLAATPSIEGPATIVNHGSRRVDVNYTLAGDAAIVTVDFQTNYVEGTETKWASIGGRNYANLVGDVNHVVEPGERHVYWNPELSWPNQVVPARGLRAVVKAFPTNSPPDYLVIDLETGAIAAGSGGDATLVAKAFGTVFTFGGIDFGSMFIAIALLLFAFTTVLGWSHYGSTAFAYLFGEKATVGFKTVFVIVIMAGSMMTSSLAWDISDTFNGLMMIPNLIGVITLSGIVMKITKNYVDRNLRGLSVEPMLSYDPKTQKEQAEALKNGQNESAK